MTKQEAILRTVVYHDLFDFPLTAQEIHLTMPARAELWEVVAELESAPVKERLSVRGGLYFLRGREEVVDVRRTRFDLAEFKFNQVKKFFRFAKLVPFLRAVFVCNTLSRSNAREASDIDLFVVTAPGRVWLVRLLVTGLAALLKVRPTKETTKDRLCLSFFVTSDALDLRSFEIGNDVYLPHWLLDLYPIYDEAGIPGNLFTENAWAREILPGLKKQLPSDRRVLQPSFAKFKAGIEKWLDRRGGVLELWAKEKQLGWMPGRLKKHVGEGTGVVLTDSVLKLHVSDRRTEIRNRYFQKLKEVLPDTSALLAETEESSGGSSVPRGAAAEVKKTEEEHAGVF